MQVLTIANEKGGVGKTTLSFHIIAELANRGHRVLAVDLDPTRYLTNWFNVDLPPEASVTGLYDDTRRQSVKPLRLSDNVALLGADADLGSAEANIGWKQMRVLRYYIEEINGQYDFVVFDCHNGVGQLVISALAASTGVLIPAGADGMSVQGSSQFVDTLNTVKKEFNEGLRIIGFVVNGFDPSGRPSRMEKATWEAMEEEFGKFLFRSRVTRSVRAKEAWNQHTTVWEVEPESRIAKEMRAVVTELCVRLGMATWAGDPGEGAKGGKGEAKGEEVKHGAA